MDTQTNQSDQKPKPPDGGLNIHEYQTKMQKTHKCARIDVFFSKNGGHLGFMSIVKTVQARQSSLRRK